MSTPDGGPAFPPHVAEIHGLATHSGEFGLPGMSLRDYFAAQALVGFLMVSDCRDNPTKAATWAYEQADEMLKAREP